MAFDLGLVDRVRDSLSDEPGLSERKVFGSYCFMLDGNICNGVSGDRLIARVPSANYETLLDRDGVGKFPTDERPMTGWVAIEPDFIAEDEELEEWIGIGVQAARALPPK